MLQIDSIVLEALFGSIVVEALFGSIVWKHSWNHWGGAVREPSRQPQSTSFCFAGTPKTWEATFWSWEATFWSWEATGSYSWRQARALFQDTSLQKK